MLTLLLETIISWKDPEKVINLNFQEAEECRYICSSVINECCIAIPLYIHIYTCIYMIVYAGTCFPYKFEILNSYVHS